ncbi:hypothetical protein [Sphingomonas sp.]|uniref:hypothetical protein n=1 Tax=Sphingomonas sp. TaxID=28214 RepID=UPI0038A110DD
MASSRLSLLAAAILAFGTAACDRLPHWGSMRAGQSSVTVKLPPPRPAAPAPGFAFAPEGVRP